MLFHARQKTSKKKDFCPKNKALKSSESHEVESEGTCSYEYSFRFQKRNLSEVQSGVFQSGGSVFLAIYFLPKKSVQPVSL